MDEKLKSQVVVYRGTRQKLFGGFEPFDFFCMDFIPEPDPHESDALGTVCGAEVSIFQQPTWSPEHQDGRNRGPLDPWIVFPTRCDPVAFGKGSAARRCGEVWQVLPLPCGGSLTRIDVGRISLAPTSGRSTSTD